MARPTNQRFALAVHLLTLLGESPEQLMDSRELSISPATNPAHVRRVLGLLRDAGLVHSQQGNHGGWNLALRAEEIDLGRVWRAVNDTDPLLGLHVPDPGCPTGRRVQQNLQEIDRRALHVFIEELEKSNVADMISEARAER
jgi:Rrf2 family protein